MAGIWGPGFDVGDVILIHQSGSGNAAAVDVGGAAAVDWLAGVGGDCALAGVDAAGILGNLAPSIGIRRRKHGAAFRIDYLGRIRRPWRLQRRGLRVEQHRALVQHCAIGVGAAARRSERGTIVGLLVGFGGVMLLLSRNLGWDWRNLLPQLAIVLAAICYAAGSAYARAKLRQVGPVVAAFGQLLVADLFVWAAALLFEDFGGQRLTWPAVGALLWLGVLGSCLAYIFYFFILQQWGATRTTLVTYLLPVVGVSAGALFLGEWVDWRLLAGGLLILSGVGAVNWRPKR